LLSNLDEPRIPPELECPIGMRARPREYHQKGNETWFFHSFKCPHDFSLEPKLDFASIELVRAPTERHSDDQKICGIAPEPRVPTTRQSPRDYLITKALGISLKTPDTPKRPKPTNQL